VLGANPLRTFRLLSVPLLHLDKPNFSFANLDLSFPKQINRFVSVALLFSVGLFPSLAIPVITMLIHCA